MREFYPNAKCSDYGHNYKSAQFPSPGSGGHFGYLWGTGSHVGTHQSKSFYGAIAGLANKWNFFGPGTGFYRKNPYNAFRLDANEYRSMVLSNPAVPAAPWICR